MTPKREQDGQIVSSVPTTLKRFRAKNVRMELYLPAEEFQALKAQAKRLYSDATDRKPLVSRLVIDQSRAYRTKELLPAHDLVDAIWRLRQEHHRIGANYNQMVRKVHATQERAQQAAAAGLEIIHQLREAWNAFIKAPWYAKPIPKQTPPHRVCHDPQNQGH